MGLLFQPRRVVLQAAHHPWRGDDNEPSDRTLVFRAAFEAVVVGDASRFDEFFTPDVAFTSPHLAVTSRQSVQAAFGAPEDSLSDVAIDVLRQDTGGDTVVAEWRLAATFSGALLFDDSVLIEPTGGRVVLTGVSVAEFRGLQICTFRHYFDDTQLLDQVPRLPLHLRWTSR